MFAGRNISASHAALTSTRVMGTCAVMGQAIGTAAWIAVRDGLNPRGVYEKRMEELSQTLIYDDCYIPFAKMDVGPLTKRAALTGSDTVNIENLRNGLDRPVNGADNGWYCGAGGYFEYRFESPEYVRELRLVFDSDLNRGSKVERNKTPEDEYSRDALAAPEFKHATKCNTLLSEKEIFLPGTLVCDFCIEGFGENGETVFNKEFRQNPRRLVVVNVSEKVGAVRVTIEKTHGFYPAHVFSATVR